MATVTGTEIMARARTIATQTTADANVSQVVDSLGGLRALLNHSIREVYRRKSGDQKFTQDISVRHTVVIGSGEGTVPDAIMRPYLEQAYITDDNSALVSYKPYKLDTQQAYGQLGYAYIVGDTFYYIAPLPDGSAYSGNLYVTVASFPTLPSSMEDTITFPSDDTIDDVILMLAHAILGRVDFSLVGA